MTDFQFWFVLVFNYVLSLINVGLGLYTLLTRSKWRAAGVIVLAIGLASFTHSTILAAWKLTPR